MEDPDGTFQKQAFEGALEGIKKSTMDYSKDPILPLFLEKIRAKTKEYKDLTPEM